MSQDDGASSFGQPSYHQNTPEAALDLAAKRGALGATASATAATAATAAAPPDDASVHAGAAADLHRPARYLRLDVPNFNAAADEAEQMTSYLRLGTIEDPATAGNPDAPRATGEDLAAKVTSFLDDDRRRRGCPDFVPVRERRAETARLHTKGGWRDHSDGNRITTTRGDKVEVVRGSYALLVLGREDEGGTGWDVSGGHIEGIGGRSQIEWVQTYDGTWKTRETSEKGDVEVTQHGDTVTRTYGDLIDSTTGSEDETRPWFDDAGDPVGVPAPNPEIRDRTWARRIASYTGSSGRRVPHVSSETWAETLASKTDATTLRDETTAGVMESTTTAGAMMSTTIAREMLAVTLADATNLTVGNTQNLTVGLTENVTLGAVLDFTLALMVQVCVSGTLALNVGPRKDFNLAGSTALTSVSQDVVGMITRVSSAESVTTGAFTVSAARIDLG